MTARARLLSKPLVEIPEDQRWMKSYGDEAEYELVRGVHLREFGFKNGWIPNGEFGFEIEYPRGFDQRLFNSEFLTPDCPVEIEHRLEYVRVDRSRFIFSQNYVDPDRVRELLEQFDYSPVTLCKVGRFYWCSNGTHRIVARMLRGNVILAKVAEFLWKK